MRIEKRMLKPSRPDAERLTRTEKTGMLVLAYAATVLDELREEMKNRLGMIGNGAERMRQASEITDGILDDLRLTIPENQRMSLQNTGNDYEMRLMPKATPGSTSVLLSKEEFRTLVDAARFRCRECADDDEECRKCDLFRMLTCILPLDDYHGRLLCPYNLGKWAN